MLFRSKLRTGVKIKRQGALTVGEMGCGDVLEKLGGCVGWKQARNDDGGEDGETLVQEANGLNRLLAAQLLDLESVAIDAARRESKQAL